MRYGTQVFFQKRVPGAYDSDTGNYEEDKIQETLKYASVMDTQTKMLKLVYGSIKQGRIIVKKNLITSVLVKRSIRLITQESFGQSRRLLCRRWLDVRNQNDRAG